MECTRMSERELTMDEAQRRIAAELQALALRPTVRILGANVVSVLANLEDRHGNRVARGAGKGYLDQARLGALYEALEHHWTDTPPGTDMDQVSARYFCEITLFSDDLTARLFQKQSDTKVACRTYTCPTRNISFCYPLVLTAPHHVQQAFEQDISNYYALKRYSSNSGTAIGASYNEALLHAANECIERDAVSLFLLDHFYYENPKPLRCVARPDRHDPLGNLWADAEREIGGPIVLLDISTEFAARTFLAFSTSPGALVRVFGSGCSLDPRHGAWRALTELVQLHHALTEPECQRDLANAERHLQAFPRLLRCLRFNPHTLLHRSERHDVLLPESPVETSLQGQIAQLAEDLQQHGRTLGVTTLHQTEKGTTLVNVVIPGLERFYIVSSGNVVVPQARGRRLRQDPDI